VVWRPHPLGPEIALVHRPRYDDWTLPKGKLLAGEAALLAAVREVDEELGSQVAVGRRLRTVEYPLGSATKRVNYWAMRHIGGEHVPSDEVDGVCWLTAAEAAQRLTYPMDRVVLSDFVRLPTVTSTILLMRHAKAGKRAEFKGEDQLRPLDKIGRRQARVAVDFLAAFAPRQIRAANRVRCRQTVTPLADRLSLTVVDAPEFSDEACLADPDVGVASLLHWAERSSAAVICSQGKAIPRLLARLQDEGAPVQSRKGSVWALSVACGVVIAADYYPHPGI